MASLEVALGAGYTIAAALGLVVVLVFLYTFLRAYVVHPLLGRPPLICGWIPWVGVGLEFSRDPDGLLRRLRKKYGNIYTIHMAGRDFTFGHDAEFISTFYKSKVTDLSFFEGLKSFPAFQALVPVGETGPEIAHPGTIALKRLVVPKVPTFCPAMNAEILRQCDETFGADGGGELADTLRNLVLAPSMHILLGSNRWWAKSFLKRFGDFDDALVATSKNPFNSKILNEGKAIRADLLQMANEEVQRRKAANDSADDLDFMSVLMRTKVDGELMPDDWIAGDCVGFTFGTIANTHATASWVLLQCVRDPELMERVLAEVVAVEEAGGFNDKTISQCPLLNAITQEVLRYFSPPLQVRGSVTAFEHKGYKVPANSLVAVAPCIINREETVYDDPGVFDPDRWINGPRSPANIQTKSPLQFVTFGAGLHACPGRFLARLEIPMVIGNILLNYKVSTVPSVEGLPQAEMEKAVGIDTLTSGMYMPKGPVSLRCAKLSGAEMEELRARARLRRPAPGVSTKAEGFLTSDGLD